MTWHVRDGGTWKEVTGPQVRDGGVWKPVLEGHVRDGGVWKKFFGGLTATLFSFSATHYVIDPNTATAGVRMNTSGIQERLINVTYTNMGSWRGSGTSADFEVRCTLDSGTLDSGTTGTWLSMSSSREWWCRVGPSAGFATQTASITLEIRLAASPFTVLDSSSHTLTAGSEI